MHHRIHCRLCHLSVKHMRSDWRTHCGLCCMLIKLKVELSHLSIKQQTECGLRTPLKVMICQPNKDKC